jgi:hypothetical protein
VIPSFFLDFLNDFLFGGLFGIISINEKFLLNLQRFVLGLEVEAVVDDVQTDIRFVSEEHLALLD